MDEFIILSALWRYKSSIPSLSIDKKITKANGAIAVTGLRGEIIGIDCN